MLCGRPDVKQNRVRAFTTSAYPFLTGEAGAFLPRKLLVYAFASITFQPELQRR